MHSPPSDPPSQVSTHHQAAIQTNSRSHPDTKTTAIDMDSLDQYYEFSPSDARLIDAYLRPKLAAGNNNNNIPHHSCIHDADVNSDHPYNLARNHAPAHGTVGDKGKGVWFFFSPVRYVGGRGSGGSRGGHRKKKKNRARTVLGAEDDGRRKKKGAWHTEGKRTKVDGTVGGYFQKLSYHEVTPSGSVVKPGWLMVEYAIDEEHGGGDLVLCKVYRSPRVSGHAGPGSESEVSLSCKRKACVVDEQPDVVEQHQHRTWKKRTREEDMFSAANLMHHEDLTLTATDHYEPPPAPEYYRETEHMFMLGSGGESAATEECTWKAEPDQVPADEGFIQLQPQAQQGFHKLFGAGDDDDEMALQQQDPRCAAAPKEDENDDDDVVEISFGEFTASSSSSSAALAGAVPPPSAAQPEDNVGSFDQMSSQLQEVQILAAEEDDDGGGDKIEFTFEELMGSSMPGQCSISMSSLLPTDDEDGDEDDDGMCGLACPPMDYAIIEALLKLGPDIVGEEDFICDLC